MIVHGNPKYHDVVSAVVRFARLPRLALRRGEPSDMAVPFRHLPYFGIELEPPQNG